MVDYSLRFDASGIVEHQSANTGKIRERVNSSFLHEPGHMSGFDERYALCSGFAIPISEYKEDIMSNSSTISRIMFIHLKSIYDLGRKMLEESNGNSIIEKSVCPEGTKFQLDDTEHGKRFQDINKSLNSDDE